jgi:hypothetical protein
MSCPDWRRLVALGDAAAGVEEPPEWHSAVEHLRHCSACRPEALAADPSLVFVEAAGWQASEAEVEELIGGVRAVNRLKVRDRAASTTARRWPGLAAAALLAVGLALMGGSSALERGSGERPARSTSALFPAQQEVSSLRVGSGLTPVVEELDRPDARVYQLRQEDLAIVMIVDETFDL